MIKIRMLFIALSLLFLSNCTYTHKVSVYVSPELREYYGYYPSLEVDIVSVNEDEKNWLDSYDIDKYFEAENPLRVSLKPLTMKFSQKSAGMQYITRKSAFWKKAKKKGAKEVYVLVNLPETDPSGKNYKRISFVIKSNIFRCHCKYLEIKRSGLAKVPESPAWATNKGRNLDAF